MFTLNASRLLRSELRDLLVERTLRLVRERVARATAARLIGGGIEGWWDRWDW